MSISARLVAIIHSIATGNGRRKAIVTPFGAVIFIGIITLFILSGIQTDKWLNLPQLVSDFRFTISAILWLFGFTIAGWSVTQFLRTKGTPVPLNPPPQLITTGIYAYTRNPMIIGGLFILEGLGFWLGSLSTIVVFAPLPILFYALFIINIEEPELGLRFGKEYVEYKKKVPRFLPKMRREG